MRRHSRLSRLGTLSASRARSSIVAAQQAGADPVRHGQQQPRRSFQGGRLGGAAQTPDRRVCVCGSGDGFCPTPSPSRVGSLQCHRPWLAMRGGARPCLGPGQVQRRPALGLAVCAAEFVNSGGHGGAPAPVRMASVGMIDACTVREGRRRRNREITRRPDSVLSCKSMMAAFYSGEPASRLGSCAVIAAPPPHR